MSTVECPPRLVSPRCLDKQIGRVQEQRAWLAENGWQHHHLAVILYFKDGKNIPFTFTSLHTFQPLPRERGHVWIVGVSREHPEGIKRDYLRIVRISSEIVPRQVYNN